MTEEGKKLFKKASIGMVILFGLMIILNLVSSMGNKSKPLEKSEKSVSKILEQLEQEDNSSETVASYSATQKLVKLIHTDAFNHFRSGRLKDAIRLWEIAGYLEPTNPILQLRLSNAKSALNKRIEENTAIAEKDYKALRLERAIEFYRRAANYADNFNPDLFNKIQRKISRIEREIAR